MPPKVSIVILCWHYMQYARVCLNSLTKIEGVPYEVVVVSQGNTPEEVAELEQFKAEGKITTLVLEPKNTFFTKGNNIGFRNCNPASEYIILLNSDIAIRRPDWLEKFVGWMEGTTKYYPTEFAFHPTVPTPGPRDIVSMGFAYDAAVKPGNLRPDGFCIMIRRSVWIDLDEDFPMSNGLEHSLATAIRKGAKCGVLWNYVDYFVHREEACRLRFRPAEFVSTVKPDLAGWFNELNIESLDFHLGEYEHDSYWKW